MRVAVVILNFNGKALLEKFLPTVIEHSHDADIIVADNCSTDDSVPYLKKHFPDVGLIQNKENGGFAKGYNDALTTVDADIFVLINSDIEVTPGWLGPILSFMKENSDVAAVQPKILAYDDKSRFEHAGAAGGFIDKWGYAFCRGRIFDHTEKDEGQYDDTTEVFWASGACMFIRAETFKEFKGFDEDFFAHMEEIDLCWRMKNQGHKIYCVPESAVYHVGGGTLDYMSPKKTYLNFRNNLYMIHKNYRGKSLGTLILWRMILDGLAATKFLLGFKFRHWFAVLKAHFSYYGNLRRMGVKRQELKQKDGPINNSGVYTGSIVGQYFMKGKRRFLDL